MKGRLLLLLGMMLFVASAVAQVKGDGSKLRILTFPSGNDYPAWAITRLKLDKKYGFDAEIVPMQPGPPTMNAFRAGAVDAGNMNWLELARLRTLGEKVTGITPFLQWPNMIVVPAKSSVRDVADLKGKKVGTWNRVTPEWLLFIASTRAKAGFDPRTDSTIHEAGPGLLRGLLDRNELDAAAIFYNLGVPMVASGQYRVLTSSRDLLGPLGLPTDIMLSTWAFREDYVRQHPANVRAFVAAYQEAVQYMDKNDEIWIEALARQDIKDPKVVASMRDWSRAVTLQRFSPTVNDDVRKMFDVLYGIGGKDALGIDKLPEGMIDQSYYR
jgi:NitT/TauT family transport system substrate-binding protein